MTKPITDKLANEQVEKDIVTILTMQPLYTKPGLSKEDSREIELIHKRDQFLNLVKEAKLDLIKEFEGVIGKDMNTHLDGNVYSKTIRVENELKAEQRTKLEAIKRNL